ncbi:DUF2157 domain-containing protein [Hoyosella sp. G463]|uniref:DUF2157 domain-containing protein n=1 Tax=Lolliginicoccus lacisalsi TaxID=2742202 RepID=A0A927J9G8_9ACTN|nr:DUF2157 domain-containing protein [Lolliginicoccus lacisalsi]MBD8505059.1 DUF2157 domain-containing protein [Lolliginicoccus lacisalsi]
MTTSNALDPAQLARLQNLVDSGVLREDQREAVVAALEAGYREDRAPLVRRVLPEVAGYVGGALVVAGATLLLGLAWEDLSRDARALILAVTSLVLIIAAVGFAGGVRALPSNGGSARQRLGAVLFAAASVTIAFAAGSFASSEQAMWAGLAGLVVAVCAYVAMPALVTLSAGAVMSVVAVAGTLGELNVAEEFLAVGLVVLGIGWLVLAARSILAPAWAGFLVGVAIAVIGSQLGLGADSEAWAYSLAAVVAVACFVLFAATRSPILVIGGVLATALAVSEAVWHWTGGAIGGAAAVLIAGTVLLVGSAVGLYRARVDE